MNGQAHNLWVLVADQSQARIIHITAGEQEDSDRSTSHASPSRTGPAGTTKAQPFQPTARGQEQARLVNTFPDADRHRPDRASAAGHTFEHLDTEGERLRRFAKEITHWVAEQMNSSLLGQIVVFSPAKMLGHFREMFPKEGLGSIELKEGNFVYMTAPEIATHPAVTEMMATAGANDQ